MQLCPGIHTLKVTLNLQRTAEHICICALAPTPLNELNNDLEPTARRPGTRYLPFITPLTNRGLLKPLFTLDEAQATGHTLRVLG